MSDNPYAIIIDGSGTVTEMKLGNHDGGRAVSKSVQVVSNQVENGIRTVVLTRSFKGQTADHYTFDPSTTSTIPILTASGKASTYAYHGPTNRYILLFTYVPTLGVQVRNMKMDSNTGGTWHRVGQ